ncbi:hypothetical protein ILYODFUR_010259 [Ilyodon furcidens]|uniref:Secreted protein n=1 Tax=Ilyodon furcidens TaxID=33524 RepID=A0ABV0UHR0_9TELE
MKHPCSNHHSCVLLCVCVYLCVNALKMYSMPLCMNYEFVWMCGKAGVFGPSVFSCLCVTIFALLNEPPGESQDGCRIPHVAAEQQRQGWENTETVAHFNSSFISTVSLYC